jgi:hypothetical protein
VRRWWRLIPHGPMVHAGCLARACLCASAPRVYWVEKKLLVDFHTTVEVSLQPTRAGESEETGAGILRLGAPVGLVAHGVCYSTSPSSALNALKSASLCFVIDAA